MQEVKLAHKGLAPELPWFYEALHKGTLKHVYTFIGRALAVSYIALLCAAASDGLCLCCAVLYCAVTVSCYTCADTDALGHRAVCGFGKSNDSRRGSMRCRSSIVRLRRGQIQDSNQYKITFV